MSMEFKLEQLFGSTTRARLLGLFLMNPGASFFVRELTRKIDAQLNSVRRELKNLVDLGLVTEQVAPEGERLGAKLADKKKFYTVNTSFVIYADLRALFKKVQLLMKNTIAQEIASHGTLDYFAFTGKFVDRTDIATDLVIVGDLDPAAVQRAVAAYEAEIGHEVNYTLMRRDEFVYRKQINDRFLSSILVGDKIVTVNAIGL